MLKLQLYFYSYPESKQSTDTPVVNAKIFDGAAVASSNAYPRTAKTFQEYAPTHYRYVDVMPE